jgi:hypothetical protein
MLRSEFSLADQVAIVRRATDSSFRIHCEGCGAWLKSRKDYEIDHRLAEGMRVDRSRKLTAKDGQLLCVAVCHPQKTRADKGSIAEAKRREAAELGLKRPSKVKIPRRPKPVKAPLQVAAGAPEIMRRFG